MNKIEIPNLNIKTAFVFGAWLFTTGGLIVFSKRKAKALRQAKAQKGSIFHKFINKTEEKKEVSVAPPPSSVETVAPSNPVAPQPEEVKPSKLEIVKETLITSKEKAVMGATIGWWWAKQKINSLRKKDD